MTKPYTSVPSHVRERLEIAIVCGESMQLQWQDESEPKAYVATVTPDAVVERGGMAYLEGVDDDGQTVRIRIDLIRNFPTPYKG